ncbi:MAG: efflux RND transporter periplasmic adaptor subunit, partial [Verrucomicrobiota bacterium]
IGETKDSNDRILQVETIAAAAEDHFVETRSFLGKVEAARASQLGFELSGTIQVLGFEEGETVKAGEMVAKLEASRLEAQKKQLMASMAEVEASVRLAKATYVRSENLWVAKVASKQSLDESRQQLEVAEASLSNIAAQLEAIEVDLAKSVLKAPFSGVIAQRYVDEGTMVTPGQAVFQILETERLEIRAGVSPAAAGVIEMSEVFDLDDGVKAKLVRKIPVRDARTRTVDLILSVDATDEPLYEGDLVEIPIARTKEAKGFWLPRDALTESRRGLWACYVAANTDEPEVRKLDRRQIEVLHASDDRVYVRGAIENGDQIVSRGLHKLAPGLRVSTTVSALASN